MTAHSDTKKAAERFGLAFEPAYAAYAHVARTAGYLVGPGRRSYDMTGQPLAEALLAMFAAGTGLAPDLPAFLTAIRDNGAAATLGNLLELAAAGDPEHLTESAFTADSAGRVLWCFVSHADRREIEVDGVTFGGHPAGRTVTIAGSALIDVLA